MHGNNFIQQFETILLYQNYGYWEYESKPAFCFTPVFYLSVNAKYSGIGI